MRMEKRRVCLHRYWRYPALAMILLCLWMIFHFSGQDGGTSDSLSSRVTALLLETATGNRPDLQSLEFARANHVIRKLAHMTEYGMLAFSCAVMTHTFPFSIWKRHGISAAASAFVASLDEYMQTFSMGRDGRVRDVFIDIGGAALALLLFMLLWRISERQWRKAEDSLHHA